MDKKKIVDIVMLLSIIGMIVCLGIEVADKTNVGYNTIGDRLKFGWWFYMQGGREKTLTELERNALIQNPSLPLFTLNLSDEMVQMNDVWRVIARRLYESENTINTSGNAF